MREDTPSLTAVYVAFARALATRDQELSRACSDPCAEVLLPRALLPLLTRAEGSPAVRALLRTISLGMTDHVALRTALIDSAVDHATGQPMGHAAEQVGAHGIEQVVLLGAGLDARAHRLPSLANAVVFEVDHPATQKLKRSKAHTLPQSAREIRYAACDFERTHLEQALLGSGFDRHARSLWIWEGVTMYLPAAAVVDSLSTIGQLSAPDSVLVATYITPDLVVGGTRPHLRAHPILALRRRHRPVARARLVRGAQRRAAGRRRAALWCARQAPHLADAQGAHRRRNQTRQSNVITHIVLMKFKADTTPENKREAVTRLRAMVGRVPSVRELEVGLHGAVSARSADLGLIVRLADLAALAEYADDPVHSEVKRFLAGLLESATVVDFES
jgi:methyltransferase (TIGR00027 family)